MRAAKEIVLKNMTTCCLYAYVKRRDLLKDGEKATVLVPSGKYEAPAKRLKRGLISFDLREYNKLLTLLSPWAFEKMQIPSEEVVTFIAHERDLE